jgi:hypothetical protein
MSRFTETLERNLEVIADRATPSPDAWAQIQSRIDDQEPFQETEIIMLTENTLTRRRWPLVAAAAAVAALAIGAIALVNRGDGDEQPADVPTPTVAPAPEPESAPDAAAELPPIDSQVAPGRYTSDAEGVTVTFTLDEGQTAPWTLRSNQEPGGIQLWSDDSGREFIAIGRVGSWYDADEARDQETTGLGSISPDDIDAWIEQNGIIVTEREDLVVGNRPTQYRQFRLDTTPGATADFCPPGEQPCLWAMSGSADLVDAGSTPVPFGRDRLHSVWLVDMGDFEPLIVVAIPNLSDEQTWFEEIVRPIVDSMEFGEPAPVVEGGTARLSTFGSGTTVDGELPAAGEQVVPGTYTTDAIGTPVTVDIRDGQTGPWTLVSNDRNGIQLISDETGREFMAIGRIGSWFDAEEARTEGTRGLGSIPADGIDTWIAANGVIVVDSAEVQVGGRDASYRLIRLDTTPGATADFCPADEAPCLWAASGSADLVDAESTPVPFGRDRVQAVWSVDMGEFEPVFIFAAANLDDDGPWFTDVVLPLVDSIRFGEPAPVIEGGTARVPLRVTVAAAYSGVRTDGAPLADGSVPITYLATSDAPAAGEIVGIGSYLPGAETIGSDEYTFTGTIDGIGTGTLTYTDEWTATGPAESTIITTITGGTGDFVGATGTGTSTVDTSDKVGADDTITGTNTFDLVVPRTG